jgi:NADH-quinone oxidoreductase subunit E
VAKVGFSDAVLKEVAALFGRYPEKVHALLPVLHIAQRENKGWLPPGWEAYLAELCETTLNHVRGVVTFYNMYKTEPVGKYHILVCTCLPCGLCGGAEVLEHLEHRLGITPGNTTADGLFSLEEAQCLAACDQAPLMLVNEDLQKRITLEQIDRWIAEARAKKA